MTQESKLEWTEYKSRFRAVTVYGTYWVELFESGTGYQLICGTNPCCEVFASPQDAKDYAQAIHDRPSSRDDWFNLSDVEQAPYHAPLDRSELLRTYETLLAGDNLPERIAVQTVDLRALLEATKPVDVTAIWNEAVERSAVIADSCVHLTPDVGNAVRNLKQRALSPAEPAQGEQWHDISLVSEREHGRLIIVGAFDGKGRWCASVRRAQRFIDHYSEPAGSLKKALRLKWEPTHFMEMTTPSGALPPVSLAKNNQSSPCCTHCNDTGEVKIPHNEYHSQCPECVLTSERCQ